MVNGLCQNVTNQLNNDNQYQDQQRGYDRNVIAETIVPVGNDILPIKDGRVSDGPSRDQPDFTPYAPWDVY